MLNFLGAIASLLPNYVQGRRQAISDNWQDLQNFNNIQKGQLENAFTEAAWQPRLDMLGDVATSYGLQTLSNGMNTALQSAAFPRMYWNYQMGNMWGPAIDNANYNAQLRAYQLAAKNPLVGMGGGLFGNPAASFQNGINPKPSGV